MDSSANPALTLSLPASSAQTLYLAPSAVPSKPNKAGIRSRAPRGAVSQLCDPVRAHAHADM